MEHGGFLNLSLGDDSKESGDQRDLSFHISFCHALPLPFPDHVHHLEPLEGSPCCLKREKAHPWLCEAFHEPMILLDPIVEVFHLPQFSMFRKISFCFELIKCFGVGGVFVHIDHTGLAGMRSSKCLEQELLGRVCISCWAQKEIERVSFRINGSIQIHPLLFDLNVRLIDSPRVIGGIEVGPAAFLQFGSVALNESR